MNKINVSEITDKAVDFYKSHYEYLLPFSLFYVLINLPLKLPFSYGPLNGVILPLTILVLPLAFSIPFFAEKISQNETKKRFGLFFEIYNYFFKFFGIQLLRWLIILVMLLPFILSFVEVLSGYDYDPEKLQKAIDNRTFVPSFRLLITLLVTFFLMIFSAPFLLFVEYYGILDGHSITSSFVKSYHLGASQYLKILSIILLSFLAAVAGIMACVIGFVFAFPFIYLLYYYTYRALEPKIQIL